jgi:superfamily I DNA/RNA helicase
VSQTLTVVVGGPGAGKTERLLTIMETAIAAGVPPSRIAFCSFTRNASYGARDRAIKRFGGEEKDYPYFRTLHSIAYRELSLSEGSIMQAKHYADIANALNLKGDDNFVAVDGPVMGRPSASKLLGMCELARNRRANLEDVWKETRNPDLGWYTVKRYRDTLASYKRETGLMDFTDIMDLYLGEGMPLPVQVAIVDEAQDLTPLQWQVVQRAFGKAREVYVAGDDDQAIFRWAGADVETFMALEGSVLTLDKSHRLPSLIFDAAAGVAKRIRQRRPKEWASASEGGHIQWHRRVESVPATQEGSWLMLARNDYMLDQFAHHAQRNGIFFTRNGFKSVAQRDIDGIVNYERLRAGHTVDAEGARRVLQALGKKVGHLEPSALYGPDELGIDVTPIWHEAFKKMQARKRVYIVECLRRGEKLTQPPRVRLDTIHGAKGAEAENVILRTDMSTRTKAGLRRNPDDELRCLYVGVTRASKTLHMMLPSTVNNYGLTPNNF